MGLKETEQETTNGVKWRTREIEGVPHIKQRYGDWCGYASLSMVLQYWGHRELSPEAIFAHIHGEFTPEAAGWNPAPSVGWLAAAARELAPDLKVDLIDASHIKLLQERGAKRGIDVSPLSVLDRYVLERQVPCIVRMSSGLVGHFVVVRGIDEFQNGERIQYRVNDPIYEEYTEDGSSFWGRDQTRFEICWRNQEVDYPGETSYLMLAIYPHSGG